MINCLDKRRAPRKSIRKNEEGSTGVMFALLAVPMFAMVGMAIEFSRTLNARDAMQNAIDAAVLAARNVAPEDQAAVAQTYFKANLKKIIGEAQANFTRTDDGNIAGSAIVDIKTPIAALAGAQKVTVEVAALAKPDGSTASDTDTESSAPCFEVLDQSGSKTFWMDSNSGIDAHNCQVRVRSNHNSAAMYEVSSSNVKFKRILVKGYATVNSTYSTGGLYIADEPHRVTENAQVVGNPFQKAVSEVSREVQTGSCTNANTNKTWSGAVQPGTYCGTTEFKNATFSPGIYVIASGNGNNKNGNLKLSGKLDGSAGITFYLADNKSNFGSYTAYENSVLKAPSSGVTKGLLFFENSNRGNNYSLTISSVNKQSWTGVVYLPSIDITLESLSQWPVFNVALTANQVKLKSLSGVVSPFVWTPYGYSDPILITEAKMSSTEGWLMK
ncbi:MAG: TadE/TadG family type IV pilus assembly protein [Hyphomicrobium sp.]